MSADRVKVHNADWFVETMQACDWSAPSDGVPRAPRVIPVPTGERAKQERAEQQRQAFAEKQSVREKEFQAKFEVIKKEAERRVLERQLKKEKQFEERFQEFTRRNRTLVEEVDGPIRAEEAWRTRRRERLYAEWTTAVFQPMQEHINAQLTAMSDGEVEDQRRLMFQRFLDESNRKTNGLFRDIIIESDYDPLQDARQATLKYKKVSVVNDPTKNRGMREAGDRSAGQEFMPQPDARYATQRGNVPVDMWGSMSATPHGRYNTTAEVTKPTFNASRVAMNHYDVPKGEAGDQLLKAEAGVRGKRTMPHLPPDPSKPTVKDCLTLPPVDRSKRPAS